MFYIAAPVFIAFTFYAWVLVDRILDRAAGSRPGSRVRRAAVRQVGALLGWYLIAFSLTMWSVDVPEVALALTSIGSLLIVLAIIAKRRGDAPLFWPAP
jgi:hypothetical protein